MDRQTHVAKDTRIHRIETLPGHNTQRERENKRKRERDSRAPVVTYMSRNKCAHLCDSRRKGMVGRKPRGVTKSARNTNQLKREVQREKTKEYTRFEWNSHSLPSPKYSIWRRMDVRKGAASTQRKQNLERERDKDETHLEIAHHRFPRAFPPMGRRAQGAHARRKGNDAQGNLSPSVAGHSDERQDAA